ncbi:MAG: tetratricopeptide repeat protein [Cytophagales bacterium]
MKYLYLLSIVLFLFSCNTFQNQKKNNNPIQTIETITILGDTLHSPEIKDGKSFDQFKSAKTTYFDNQNNAEALIWYGRRTAYLGYFQEAIKLFTLGIKNHPDDARFYRHRGHRYISTRQYNKAISDFKKAVLLTDGKVDQLEPDGLPNTKNIPLSTLHGNIWYHLGLAYYLKNDMKNALKAFNNRSVTHKYDDNIVSGGHWLYMINRRLGKIDKSSAVINEVHKDMDIIENMSYHQSCLFYKGELQESEMEMDEVALYTLANWYVYEKNDTIKAKEYYQNLLEKGNPYSFAYIAGESDWNRLVNSNKNAL